VEGSDFPVQEKKIDNFFPGGGGGGGGWGFFGGFFCQFYWGFCLFLFLGSLLCFCFCFCFSFFISNPYLLFEQLPHQMISMVMVISWEDSLQLILYLFIIKKKVFRFVGWDVKRRRHGETLFSPRLEGRLNSHLTWLN